MPNLSIEEVRQKSSGAVRLTWLVIGSRGGLRKRIVEDWKVTSRVNK